MIVSKIFTSFIALNNSVDTGKALPLLAIIHYYFHKFLRGGIFTAFIENIFLLHPIVGGSPPFSSFSVQDKACLAPFLGDVLNN